MKNVYLAIIVFIGLATTIAAEAQSSLTTPFTLTAGSGPTYLMLTWDPINGFVTRTSGQTTVVYFSSPQPSDMEDDLAEPAQIASYGYGGYTGNLNGITTGEVTADTVLNTRNGSHRRLWVTTARRCIAPMRNGQMKIPSLEDYEKKAA